MKTVNPIVQFLISLQKNNGVENGTTLPEI